MLEIGGVRISGNSDLDARWPKWLHPFEIGPASPDAALVDPAADDANLDVLVRWTLDAALPALDGLLLHSALVPTTRGAVVIAGEKNVGKSTLARRLGGVCDELTIVRAERQGCVAHSTPYWRGRPFSAAVDRIICLEKGPSTIREPLSGTVALRHLARHVVRCRTGPKLDGKTLEILARVVADAPVVRVVCPLGSLEMAEREATGGAAA